MIIMDQLLIINSDMELRQRQALLLLLYRVMHNSPALYKHFLSITTKDMIVVSRERNREIIERCYLNLLSGGRIHL